MNDVLLLLPLWPTGPCVYCDASACLVLTRLSIRGRSNVILENVITAFMDVPVLPLILAFIVSCYRRQSLYVIHCVSFLSSTAEKNLRGNAHFDHFFPLQSLSHCSFLVRLPRLRAEEPQCLLLTFSYHLSRFHRHHYSPCFLPFLWAPGLFSSHIICVLQSHQYSPSLARSTLSSAPPSYFPVPIHHFITAPWFLLQQLVWSFDLHEITALPESIWPQNMKALSFKCRWRRAIDMCAIDFSLHSESLDLWECLQTLSGYSHRLLIEISDTHCFWIVVYEAPEEKMSSKI